VKVDDLLFQCVTPRLYFRHSLGLVADVPGTREPTGDGSPPEDDGERD
jgi:hypothetical protein